MKQLDITHIVEKLYEVDKLKLLLMDEDQITLFNSLARPVLQVHDHRKLSRSIKSKTYTKNPTEETKADLISFKEGFFRSQKIENDGPALLELYFNIMDNANVNTALNPQFLEVLRMNRKLHRILQVQYRLMRSLRRHRRHYGSMASHYLVPLHYRSIWENALFKIREMKEFGRLDEFI